MLADVLLRGIINFRKWLLRDPDILIGERQSSYLKTEKSFKSRFHFQIWGKTAAELLLSRIENPDKSYSWTYVKTTPVWRESSNKKEA